MQYIFGLLGLLTRRLSLPVILFLVGIFVGAKYVDKDSLIFRAADGLVSRAGAALAPLLGRSGELAADAAEQGGEYVVGTLEEMLRDFTEEPEAEPSEGETEEAEAEEVEGPALEGEVVAAEGDIVLCQMRISNPPPSSGGVTNKSGTVRINGVDLLLMPATKSCLSSGFGYRGGKLHRGVDYYSDTGGDVLAAGAGVIAEAVSRSDYGEMIVIDHGEAIYTRYAHLARFNAGVRKGATVSSGQVLGPIGQTGASSIVHLHYEVLTGDISTRAGSFGLEAVDPFSLPSSN